MLRQRTPWDLTRHARQVSLHDVVMGGISPAGSQQQALEFSVHLFDLLSILLRCNGFAGIQKAVVDQTRQQTSKQWPFVCVCVCKFCFGKCFGASSQSNHWAGYHWLPYKIHFLSHIAIWSRNGSLLCRIRKDDTSRQQFVVSSWGTHLLSFFTFPNCFKCQMAIEWLTLSSWTTSHIAVRGSASMMLSVGLCQLPMASHYISLTKLLEPPLHCIFIISSWAKWIDDIELSPLPYDPFSTQLRKSLEFAFCLT